MLVLGRNKLMAKNFEAISSRLPFLIPTTLKPRWFGLLCVAVKLWCLGVWTSGIVGESAEVATILQATPEPGPVKVQRVGSPGYWGEVKVIPASKETGLRGGDIVRTPANISATVQVSQVGSMKGSEKVHMAPNSELPIPTEDGVWRNLVGIFHFLRRTSAEASRIETKSVVLAARKTDFFLEVSPNGDALIHVAAGEIKLTSNSNLSDSLLLTNGQAAWASGTNALTRAASPQLVLRVRSLVQTFLYYPSVLYLDDLVSDLSSKTNLWESLRSYAAGNLRLALGAYPTNRVPVENAERLYLASLVMTAGDFQQAESLLANITSNELHFARHQEITNALMLVKASAEGTIWPRPNPPRSGTAWLAESYYQQSRAGERRNDAPYAWERDVYASAKPGLERALIAATNAASGRSKFEFAWVRRAELEFSFGRLKRSEEALEHASNQVGNAQVLTLRGFLSWAQNDYSKAQRYFRTAASLDGGLGNAWLGAGLAKLRNENIFTDLRRGRILEFWRPRSESEGLRYLEQAVVVEPGRSLLHSYLGKAYYDASGSWGGGLLKSNAVEQIDLAHQLDTNDPTPYLYSALMKQQGNRINEAIKDLEQSIELNDNRLPYRSRLLLDQDRAVRGASLASVYQDAGMTEVSLREASRAVTADYANFSAHLFLANSYDAFRDPTRFNLRYETPWFSELLLANLLSPAGVGAISPNISQQEYTRMFERDRIGFSSTSDLRSDGQYREIASHSGSYGPFSYSLDLDWQRNEGVRPNNELQRTEWYSQVKYQLTPEDSVLLLTKYQDYHSGDNFQYFDPAALTISSNPANHLVHTNTVYSPNFSFDEVQDPTLLLAYHREWRPGVHTLAMAGRLMNEQIFSDKAVALPVFSSNTNGQLTGVRSTDFDVNYRSRFETWISELSQIFQIDWNALVLGARFQAGEFHTEDSLLKATDFMTNFPTVNQTVEEEFHRWSLYAYDTWEVVPKKFWFTAGLSYSDLSYPKNFRQPPVSAGQANDEMLEPKAAWIWSPRPEFTLRGAYSRSLGGVSFDESYRLEPAQLAGFIQSFRTIIPESVVGSVSAPGIETIGSALDLKFKTDTYVGLVGELLSSDVDRALGVYRFTNPLGYPSTSAQRLDYHEYSAALAVNQLLGNEWVVGASYKFTHSELQRSWPEVPINVRSDLQEIDRADLQTFGSYLLYQHRSGFFARTDANWYVQSNLMQTNAPSGSNVQVDLAGDRFPQIDIWLGYRFRKNLGDVSVGLLNVSDSEYRLNPLNPYAEMPRERVIATRIRLRF